MQVDPTQQLTRLTVIVRQQLESWRRAGVTGWLRSAQNAPKLTLPTAAVVGPQAGGPTAPIASPAESTSKEPTVAASSRSGPSPAADPDRASLFEDYQPRSEPVPDAQRPEALVRLADQVAACRQCPELAGTRTQTVFGVGNPSARLVFLGEAPGADEDRQGEPFVGRAGQLLNKIIEACTLRREDVYILNILKCRPPGNRNPSPAEACNCRPFLAEQIDIIRPEFICCLGAVAAQNLLQTNTTIGRLRGRFFRYGTIQVMATYHPAYLLRNPSAKRATWDDMQMLMRAMEIRLPSQ